MPRLTKAEKAEIARKRQERIEHDTAIVRSGVCPQCGAGIRRNLAITGWYQCEQYGAEGFRKDSAKPSCSFQVIIEGPYCAK